MMFADLARLDAKDIVQTSNPRRIILSSIWGSKSVSEAFCPEFMLPFSCPQNAFFVVSPLVINTECVAMFCLSEMIEQKAFFSFPVHKVLMFN